MRAGVGAVLSPWPALAVLGPKWRMLVSVARFRTHTHTPLTICEQITPLAETCLSYLIQGFVTIRFEMPVFR